MADPAALRLAVAAREAFRILGPPEGFLPLAELTVYLATAPKSNRAYRALHDALEAARRTPAAPVPLHLRNAPTRLMEELGYHAGYQYPHDADAAYVKQQYLPDEIKEERFYEPGLFGFEKEIGRRMQWWRELATRSETETEAETETGGGARHDDGSMEQ